jgi:predicted short-subunit dehydrogenase-like oxidoreductase (DUF2520 family)
MTASILLIGSGRLAKHLAHWHQLHHNNTITLNHWDRNLPNSELHKCLELKPIVWLAISDAAISGFYDTYLKDLGLKTVHFSGALHHPEILSAHPLMTFTEKLFEPEFYKNIHFVISGFENLQDALPGFHNPFSVISKKDKAFYHSLCVIAGNFPQMLWAEVFREAGDLKIPASAFETYIRTVTENFIEQKSAALTGPLIRKDHQTVQSNLSSLEKNRLLQDVYSAFAKEYLK